MFCGIHAVNKSGINYHKISWWFSCYSSSEIPLLSYFPGCFLLSCMLFCPDKLSPCFSLGQWPTGSFGKQWHHSRHINGPFQQGSFCWWGAAGPSWGSQSNNRWNPVFSGGRKTGCWEAQVWGAIGFSVLLLQVFQLLPHRYHSLHFCWTDFLHHPSSMIYLLVRM